jgi:choloylglycine hydrolase
MQRRAQSLVIALACTLGLSATKSVACTDVVLNKSKGVVVSGRTLDYDAELGSKICFRPSGSAVTDNNVKYTKAGFAPLTWTSKYDAVFVDAFDLQAYCDGLNNQGLAMACLWHNETEPAKAVPAGMNGLSNVSLVEYVVENAKDIDEAKSLIANLKLFLSNYQGTDMVLHWILTDRSGRSVVMELKNGSPVYFEEASKLGVLTNSPNYDQHIANLHTHNDRRLKDESYSLPGDYRPTSRFVKAAYLVDTTPPLKSAEEGINTAIQILHNVEVPKGAQSTGSYTQWMAVRDHANLRYWLISSNQPTKPKVVDLNKIDFKKLSDVRVPIDGASGNTDIAHLLDGQESSPR